MNLANCNYHFQTLTISVMHLFSEFEYKTFCIDFKFEYDSLTMAMPFCSNSICNVVILVLC